MDLKKVNFMEIKTRKRITEIPLGYTPIQINGRCMYRCGNTTKTLDGDIRRCTKFFRKDRIKQHKCEFSLPSSEDPLNNDKEKTHVDSFDQFNSLILDKICYLSGRLDISAANSCSPAMNSFVNEILKIGFFLGRQKNLKEVPRIRSVNEKTFGNRLQQIGKRKRKQDIDKAAQIGFVNLACDAGTVLTFHSLHSLITNPYYEEFPLLLDTFDCGKGYSAIQYSEFFSFTISELLDKGIEICGIVTDGLAAQTKGLKSWINLHEDSRVKAIIHVPCLAHSMNNVFVHLYSSNEKLRSIVDSISNLIPMLRTKEALEIIGRKCPKLVKTRWLYICDILRYLIDFKRDIESHLFILTSEEKERVTIEMYQLYLILFPLRIVTLYFESKNGLLCQLPQIYKIIIELFSQCFKALVECNASIEMIQILKEVIIRTIAKFMTTAHSAAITGYVLTDAGRAFLRERERGVLTQNPDEISPSWFQVTMEQMMDKYNEIFTKITEFDHEMRMSEINEEFQICAHTETNEDENINDELLHRKYNEIVDALMDLDMDQLLKYEASPNIYRTAYDTLCKYATLLRPGLNSIAIKELLDKFLFADPLEQGFKIYQDQDPNTFWRNMHLLDEFKEFSLLALHFVTLATSEADAKRMLSLQKNVMGLHMTNVGSDCLEARLRLHGKNKI